MPDAVVNPSEFGRLKRERDLYRRLLELGAKTEVEPFLEDVLSLFVELAGAKRGYIELRGEREEGPPRFWMAHGCYDDDVEEIRQAFSRGVIAEAIATGQTIVTESAIRDPRFLKRGSIRRNGTEAVLCAPIGVEPPFGVVYLQDRSQPGAFSDDDRANIELFAGHVAALAARLLLCQQQRDQEDHTLPFRKTLRAERLVGRSPALAKVLKVMVAAAPLDVGVLLTGPSGTGKTEIARILHENSARSAGPFVELNCATLPETLVESELFGAMPGAHSTAAKRVLGKVAAAEGGTLFLDEVGELRPPAQAKLLQLLQGREYYPLGSAKPVRANVRVIAATNVDLEAAVLRKEFRDDLFYRLRVMTIRVPSLAERPEDIADLAAHFCAHACDVHRLPRITLSAGAARAVAAAAWPGNVRQLAHAVESAVILAASEGMLEVHRGHLFPELEGTDARRMTFQEATLRFQEQLVRKTLEETSWNVTEAAELLDLARSHVYNLIKAFGLGRGRKGPQEQRQRRSGPQGQVDLRDDDGVVRP
ncbi:sigma 54-interacting transcriptional regulator [Sorangium sp. So ce131]|uniref:sigma 54-interacting transcriptional regulator n=1 Tax=Sorangium sp. So ce131 TaxID=3133282 RepID=UPI003F60CF3A